MSLILTAEDARPQIVGRLRDIVQNTMHQSAAVAHETCSRLHVMPFLSMTEDEFGHPNASLLRFGDVPRLASLRGHGRGSPLHHEWNARHDDPEDRIVGVVMDSATSMAGFDGMEGEATTNFFFYLGRLCEALGVCFTIIGHVRRRLSSPARIRGAAPHPAARRCHVDDGTANGGRGAPDPGVAREGRAPITRRRSFATSSPISSARTSSSSMPPRPICSGSAAKPRYLIRDAQGAFREVSLPAPPMTRALVLANRRRRSLSKPKSGAKPKTLALRRPALTIPTCRAGLHAGHRPRDAGHGRDLS